MMIHKISNPSVYMPDKMIIRKSLFIQVSACCDHVKVHTISVTFLFLLLFKLC